MAATIKIKNSSTTGAVPTSGDLVQGELAVNVTDTGLYTENASGTVVKLNAPSIDDKNTGATKHLTISTGGNLGLGVTPSAWGSGYKALQIGDSAFSNFGTGYAFISQNALFGQSSNTYINSAAASYYRQFAGAHAWFNAASGTAGNAITFTQAMTLDASGNLLVGTTSSTYSALGRGVIEVGGGSTAIAALKVNNSGAGYIYHDGTNMSLLNVLNGPLQLGTNGTERARIDSSGNLLVGTSDYTTVAAGAFTFRSIGTTNTYLSVGHKTGSISGADFVAFYYNTSQIGGCAQNGTTAVSFNTTSDHRLKTNVVALTGGLEKVMALKPSSFTWVDGRQDEGFIAHELQEVLPNVVTGEKDATNEDDSPKYQQVDYSKIVTVLTAAIQEQQAIITQLQADVAALKG